ncbi:HAD family hydrolase [Paramicrobacterium agarici]|uniref:HAD family hydrolase n=1 Tax=Paramicrobacterium agarici TaxID=630514 RepID=UPI001151F8C4|nr:HAD family hydrolase [Microbacterium agarici]TQO22281.1 Cof subfamily protein (haloacid dehalogenase superfamily)/HAD superfamily hydrolase (TIGR01484 family) [Microbacterium agarici]
MTPASKLVALDVDGTVLHENGEVSPAVLDAVATASASGHMLMLATGRSWEATEPVMQQLGIASDYVVCANGAVIMKREGDDYVRHHVETFDPTEVLRLIHNHLDDGRYLVEYPDGFRRFTEGMTEWNLDGAEMVEFDELLEKPVTRVVVVSPGHDEQEFLKAVEDMGLHKVTYAIGWTAWLDIAPFGVNKSTGLEHVRSWLGVDRTNLVAVGDGRNDIEMLRWAGQHGRSVAMGQAPDEVKDAATEVAADIAGDGVVTVLTSL